MNANYTAGRAREYKSMQLLEAAGYTPHRMAGSHGVWDVIGISSKGIILVQVKLNCKPSEEEWEAMRDYRAPSCALKLVHCYTKGKAIPIVVEVEG